MPQVQFTESRAQPLLPAPAADWTLSLARWQATNLALPLWICPAQVGQSDPTLTTWSVFVSFYPPEERESYITGQQVQWIPQYSQVPAPAAPLISQDLSTPYYYANSYQWLCNIVNAAFYAALETVWTDYITDWPTHTATKPLPPSLVYANGKFQLFLDSSSAPLQLSVGFNQQLASLLGFSTYTETWTDSINSDAYAAFVVDYSTLGLPIVAAPGSTDGPSYYVITEESNARSDGLCPIDSIMITTNAMSVQPEVEATAVLLGQDDGPTLNTTQSATVVSITDFSEPLTTNLYDWQGKVTYSPTFLRKLELTSSDCLRNIDFQMWWRCRLNDDVYPVLMNPGASVNLKIYLEKKFIN